MSQEVRRETIKHVAWLARLELTEEEEELFTEQLGRVLDYFRSLDEVNTEGVEPTFHVLDVKNVFRDDVPREGLKVQDALLNVPELEGSFIKAPRLK
ncbi:MAG: Asp-tRNA(Asn)/Glu-tRNA(Gln) amidotransferase subunit GatC [Candidatus Nezhaarchaeales archaeon]